MSSQLASNPAYYNVSCKQEEEEVEHKQPGPQQQQQRQPEQQPALKCAATSGDEEGPSTSAAAVDAGPQLKKLKFSKLGKDPGVLTNFLPDKDRELQEEELRQQLKRVSAHSKGHRIHTTHTQQRMQKGEGGKTVVAGRTEGSGACVCTGCLMTVNISSAQSLSPGGLGYSGKNIKINAAVSKSPNSRHQVA